MSLLDAFSSDTNTNIAANADQEANDQLRKAVDAAKTGAKQSVRAYDTALTSGTGYLQDYLAQAISALQGGQNLAIPALQQNLAQSRGDVTGGMYAGLGVLSDAENRGRSDLTGHMYGSLGVLSDTENRGQGYFDQALGLYQPLSQAANTAYSKYGDFYGVGGQEGFDRAQSDWQSSPLYQAMVGESSLGQQALDRQAAQRGNPYNATDTIQYQQQLVGKHLPQYTSDLWRMGGLAPELAGAQSNIYNNKASLTQNLGSQAANVTQNTGSNLAQLTGQLGGAAGQMAYGAGGKLADLSTGLGQNLADVYTGTAARQSGAYGQTGQSLADLERMIAGGQANAYMDSARLQGQARTAQADTSLATGANMAAANNAANTNTWNALLGAAGLGTSFATGMWGK
jgi:hypothetical protein